MKTRKNGRRMTVGMAIFIISLMLSACDLNHLGNMETADQGETQEAVITASFEREKEQSGTDAGEVVNQGMDQTKEECAEDVDQCRDETPSEETTKEREAVSESMNVPEDHEASEGTDGEVGMTAAEEAATQAEEEVSQDVDKTLPSYTVSEIDGIKYARSSVNVRTYPSKEGGRIGSLSKNQEVQVTGRCNETGWYRIRYGGMEEAFVCDSYLGDERVEEVQVQTASATQIETNPVPEGIVPINSLAQYKELKMKCTDEEFAEAYNAALEVVTPLVGMPLEDQLWCIFLDLRLRFDYGLVQYSTEELHYNDPYGYFIKGVASCAGCARATGLCLSMLGIPFEHVNPNQWKHQWCRVNVNGVYYICDAYGLTCGPEPGPYEHPVFE